MGYPPEFDAFWKIMPKRKGDNPKHGAFIHWQRAIKLIDPQELTRLAGIYRATKSEEAGTAFIPMVQTWLHQRRWEHLGEPEDKTVSLATIDWEWVCRFYVRTHRWMSKSPEPGYAGCECPKEIRERYGLV